MPRRKKITWDDLEENGLDENVYVELCAALDNIDAVHKEAPDIFQRMLVTENYTQGLKEFLQSVACLQNEMDSAQKMIDEALKKADEIKLKRELENKRKKQKSKKD